MNIRTFMGTDIPQIIAIWNKATHRTPLNRRGFVKNFLLDPNFNEKGFFVAEEAGEVLGYIYAIIRVYPADVGGDLNEDKAYINGIGLKYEKDVLGGLGMELIRRAEEYIRTWGEREIWVSRYTPNYIYQGINTEYEDYLTLFRQAGYSEADRSRSISVDLFSYQRPPQIDELKALREKEGFLFTDMKDEYIQPLFRYAQPGWNHRFRRLLNETMDYGKFSLIVYRGEVVGVNVFGDPYSCEERFGPFSVDAEFRGLGLGKILLHDCLTKMKERGLHTAWAQSTAVASAAAHLYAKVGFRPTGEYIVFKK